LETNYFYQDKNSSQLFRFDARASCEKKLGYLVEFKNAEEEDNVTEFIYDQFNIRRFWIGAIDPSKQSIDFSTKILKNL
jgi:hypothetical protein